MSDPLVHNPQLAAAEQLLTALPGIISARVIAGPDGHLEEIHILASAELHPKQIVRNIESALSAGLGVEVNRRIVSVAQLREGAVEGLAAAGAAPDATAASAAAPAHTAPAAPSPSQHNTLDKGRTTSGNGRGDAASRVIFLGHEVTVDAGRNATCAVIFEIEGVQVTGRGVGFDSPQGRAEAGARAVVDALRSAGRADRLGLEGVAIIDTPGHECVLVAIRPLAGRRRNSLTGTAPLRDSPEEAAILAALQATNHWRSR
jgi:ribosomal protein L12E/L44/L45/RPP1/RPP2